MATFMEKEGLLELLMMAKSRIIRISILLSKDDTQRPKRYDEDLQKLRELDKEITAIDNVDLDFEAYKAKIDEIEAPYKKFESARVEFSAFLRKTENKSREVV